MQLHDIKNLFEYNDWANEAMMQHVVNHSSYHRGQITARLMALGHDECIQNTDFSTWTILRVQ